MVGGRVSGVSWRQPDLTASVEKITWQLLGGKLFMAKEPSTNMDFLVAGNAGIKKEVMQHLALALDIPMKDMAVLLSISYKTISRMRKVDRLGSLESSLALLEVLVHLDESDIPPRMFVMEIEVDEQYPITKIAVDALLKGWRIPDNIQLKQMGDAMLRSADSIGFSVPSAVLPGQYNIILNPTFPGFLDCVRILSVEPIEIDQRLKEYEAIRIY